MSVNKVIVIGNLGTDPELKKTENSMVCNLSVATTDRVKKGEEWIDDTQWHRVVCWGKQAENCGKFLQKGSQVYVEGKLQTRSWDDKEGVKRYTTEINAFTVQFLTKLKPREQAAEAAPTEITPPF